MVDPEHHEVIFPLPHFVQINYLKKLAYKYFSVSLCLEVIYSSGTSVWVFILMVEQMLCIIITITNCLQ